jgi:hypothetical protein
LPPGMHERSDMQWVEQHELHLFERRGLPLLD